jgi:TonB-linked SusC/RagA family outer membrane protein
MKKHTIILAFLLFLGLQAAAQMQITGTVTGAEDGLSIPGASVVVKNNPTIGTTTDIDGKYSISIPSDAEALVFSFVGMETQEVTVGGRSVIDVVLKSEVLEMDEVVVVAYGTTKKASFTGSASTVTAEKLETVPLPTFDRALQGNVAGLQLTNASGQPGAATQVRIRGIGSISASNEPLYVIDGIPVIAGDITKASDGTNLGLATTTNTLAGLNPNDIASVTTLKDAAASSLYGSRAANGVILITTKQGRDGDTQIKVNSQYGMTWKAFDNYRPLTGDEFNELYREGLINSGVSEIEATARANDGYPRGVNTDWTDEVYRTGITQNIEVSANGGNEKTKFYVSGSYYDQEGAVIASDMNRASGRLNLNHAANEKLSFGANMSLAVVDQDTPYASSSFANPVFAADLIPGTVPVKNEDGEYNYDFTALNGFNPVGLATMDIKNLKQTRSINSGYVQWNIIPDLSIKSTLGYDYIDINEFEWGNPHEGDRANENGLGQKSIMKNIRLTTSNILTYDKTVLDDHNFNFLVGFEAEKNSRDHTYTSAQNYPNDKVTTLANAAEPQSAYTSLIESSMVSYLGQFKYDYAGRYYLSASIRRDGSSKFGADYRFANFWSVGATWRISEESFMSNLDMVNNLKLRASYGTNGNSGIDDYLALGLYGYGYDYNGNPGSQPSQIANPELTWEQNELFDIALEFRIYNFLSATIDYYNRTTSSLLLQVPLSLTTGFENSTQNVGEMVNKGWEIELTSENIKKGNLKWFTDFNIAFNKNEITKLNNDEDIIAGTKIRRVGEDFQSFYMKEWAGVNVATGEPLWYTANGGVSSNYDEADKRIVGSASPDFFGGLTNTISYKGIDFSFMFSYQYGNMVYDRWAFVTESDGNFATYNHSSVQLDRWQKPGDITDVPQRINGNPSGSNDQSTRYLHDGSYLRLKTVTLGYNLPQTVTSKLKLAGARIYAQGYNLWTLTNYEGHDPEAQVSGIMDYDLPNVTTLTFGLELKF